MLAFGVDLLLDNPGGLIDLLQKLVRLVDYGSDRRAVSVAAGRGRAVPEARERRGQPEAVELRAAPDAAHRSFDPEDSARTTPASIGKAIAEHGWKHENSRQVVELEAGSDAPLSDAAARSTTR
jgi:hypothetical protein